MDKIKRLWKSFKLRMSLLRIWFMKNLMLFIRIAIVVCLICIFTGTITAETPILGDIVYPLFAPLADEINNVIAENEIEGLMSFFSVVISLMFTISMFTVKARGIAQTDIKNPKLKYAMVQANLYFNQDGKLVKKLEKTTGTDINGDGKIDEDELLETANRQGILRGVISAFQEFNTIMKVDLKEVESEDDDDYRDIIEQANLEAAEEGAAEVDLVMREGIIASLDDTVSKKLDEEIEEIEDETIEDMMSKGKETMFSRLKFWLLNLRKKEDVIEDDKDSEVIDNNMDNDSEVVEETIEEDEVEINKTEDNKKADDEKVNVNENRELTPTEAKKKVEDDFLAQLRGRNK